MTLSWFSSLFKDYRIYAPDTIGHPGYSAETRIPAQDESSSSKSIYRCSAGMVVGVPIASFIAGTTNLQIALAFFAVVNILVLIATLVFVPSIPVKEKISYGKQLNVLRKSITWFSIIVVILLNAAIFGVYSYLAEYLQTVTNLSPNITSLLLFLYGANIIGNILAGRLLTYNPLRTVVALPFLLGITYVILFFTGHLSVATAVIILIWGIVSGIGANINQYLVTSTAPEAPDFSNGLFLSACNIGTFIGTAVGGVFISAMGTEYVVMVGILSVVVSAVFIFIRNYKYRFESTLSKVKN